MVNFTVTLTQTNHHLVAVRICHITGNVQSVKVVDVAMFLEYIGDYVGALRVKPLVITDPSLAKFIWERALALG